MVDATRFQFRLPAQQKAQLARLARASNLSIAYLTRLAIDRLLEDPAGPLLRLPAQQQTEEVAFG
jgi:hypothetical protein